MRRSEQALLLLCCALDDGHEPLTSAEYRTLALRVSQTKPSDGRLSEDFLRSLGYTEAAAQRIVTLLERQAALDVFLARAASCAITVLTRLSEQFPERLRRLGDRCPAVLFCKGDPALLRCRSVSLVGSRALRPENRAFAAEIGRLAAQENFTLCSGGAVGADRAAQESCLRAGGSVVCFVPDELSRRRFEDRVLYCSEEGWHCAFSAQRALRRNHCIHALGEKTFVAQSDLHHGGTWAGTQDNLRHNLSPVFVYHDGSPAALALAQRGAALLSEAPASLADLQPQQLSIFDEI